MRCFIIREYNVETDIIRTVEETLDRLDIERRDAFSLDINESVYASTTQMISEADFVLAILNGASPNGWDSFKALLSSIRKKFKNRCNVFYFADQEQFL